MPGIRTSTIDNMLITLNFVFYVYNFKVIPHLDTNHFSLCLYLKPPTQQMYLETCFTPSTFPVGQPRCAKLTSQFKQKVEGIGRGQSTKLN